MPPIVRGIGTSLSTATNWAGNLLNFSFDSPGQVEVEVVERWDEGICFGSKTIMCGYQGHAKWTSQRTCVESSNRITKEVDSVMSQSIAKDCCSLFGNSILCVSTPLFCADVCSSHRISATGQPFCLKI